MLFRTPNRIIFAIAVGVLVVMVGVQIGLPTCSLAALSLHKLEQFDRVESGLFLGTSTVEFVTSESEIQWIVDGRECTWQGRSFDVIQAVRKNGLIHIRAVHDDEEDRSKNLIGNTVTRELRSPLFLTKVLTAFLLCFVYADPENLDTVIHIPTENKIVGAINDRNLTSWQGEVPTPPPWTWVSTLNPLFHI